MKILSPAGNFESLKLAVYNGADEVYLGINEFNARNNIDGFTMENLSNAVDFAHLYGVRVCLAINILFTDQEILDAVNIILNAYELGVDCFILQDLGLIKIISENYPQIEIHASTQMGIHNLEGVQAVLKYGVKRVVLARETPLKEIKRIKENCSVGIEYFAQGALCVSFSGNCYLSSYLLGASGNRGRCKQLCRLPYTLMRDDRKIKKGYLLSAKDFNLSKRLKDLKDAGVDVIKIEGRARRPFYVGIATSEYYKAINGKTVSQENIRLAFNRDYTEGYFNGNGNIISTFNNHVGIEVGKVVKVNSGKNFNQVYFTSNRELSPKSTFKIFNNGIEKNVLTAYDLKKIGDENYLLTTTQKVENGGTVRLIIDELFENKVLSNYVKRTVKIQIIAKKGEPLTAFFIVNGKEITVTGAVAVQAKNSPLTQKQIIECFKKSEYFLPELTVDMTESLFVQKSALNEFRREVYDRLYSEIISAYKKNIERVSIKKATALNKFIDFQIIEKLDEPIIERNVIYSPATYTVENVVEFIEKCRKNKANPYLDTPNFALEEDIKLLKKIISTTGISIVANNYYALQLKDVPIVIGAGLNVYNSYSANAFEKPFITAENDTGERINYPYMTLRHCPIKSHVGGDCKNCKYSEGYYYLTDSGRKLKLKRKKLFDCTFYLTD
ncbi:MAG: U32 family peptidase [Clostridia bacterium]|nr:U32 family peptidase [Clostridia bacterium]